MIEATEYVKKGIMIVLREALDDEDPESWPSLWKNQHGGDIYRDVGPDWREILNDPDIALVRDELSIVEGGILSLLKETREDDRDKKRDQLFSMSMSALIEAFKPEDSEKFSDTLRALATLCLLWTIEIDREVLNSNSDGVDGLNPSVDGA